MSSGVDDVGRWYGWSRYGDLYYRSCCGGRSVAVWYTERSLQCLALFFIIAGTALLWVIVFPHIVKERFGWGVALYIVDVLVVISIFASTLAATLMDPGIFPRVAESDVFPGDADSLYKATAMPLNGSFNMKWCNSCQFHRPPRATHCRQIDCCVEEFDHHCPWISNTVGRRNYRHFLVFLTTMSVHLIMGFGVSVAVVVMVYRNCNESEAQCSFTDDEHIVVFVSSIVAAVLSAMWSLFVLTLWGFHFVLIVQMSTTNEYYKRSHPNYVDSGSILENMQRILFRPVPPSFLGGERFDEAVRKQWEQCQVKDRQGGVIGEDTCLEAVCKQHQILDSHDDIIDDASDRENNGNDGGDDADADTRPTTIEMTNMQDLSKLPLNATGLH